MDEQLGFKTIYINGFWQRIKVAALVLRGKIHAVPIPVFSKDLYDKDFKK